MQSIGNDIIDLSLIDQDRSRQPRFYSKIITEAEYALHQQQCSRLPFAHFLWLLWSVKESAYKYAKRLDNRLVFSPTRILIERIDEELNGYCVVNSLKIKFQSMLTNEYIHTVVTLNEPYKAKVSQITPEADASLAVRILLLDFVKPSVHADDFQVVKDEHQIPTLKAGNQFQPVSLSHHGRFAAFALVY